MSVKTSECVKCVDKNASPQPSVTLGWVWEVAEIWVNYPFKSTRGAGDSLYLFAPHAVILWVSSWLPRMSVQSTNPVKFDGRNGSIREDIFQAPSVETRCEFKRSRWEDFTFQLFSSCFWAIKCFGKAAKADLLINLCACSQRTEKHFINLPETYFKQFTAHFSFLFLPQKHKPIKK